ncbi:proto-oncogene tyrosine-protein kinase receptor Ret-like [Ostrea edulis]|uniref:proto-oncogene tyrosine-protein kinase receptor Ret-like n=1 Tax=Ostrea edulis TaxID=37623 RepID=UPI002094F03B|nr:proto-oncogene tyrosine-protein kinase receptor Ret-like [Ostrea edulis]
MVLNVFFTVQLWLFLLHLRGINTLYFTQLSYRFSPANSVIGRIIALPNATSPTECKSGSLRYSIHGVSDASVTVLIDQTGWIRTASPSRDKEDFRFTVRVECGSGFRVEYADVTVNVGNDGDCDFKQQSSVERARLQRTAKYFCFQREPINIFVEERNKNNIVGHLSKCLQNVSGNAVKRTYYTISDAFKIDEVTSEIRLIRELDREQDTNLISVDITCDIDFVQMEMNFVNTATVRLHVLDVNDNPPMFHDTMTKEINAGNSREVEEVIVDKDTSDFSRHDIRVLEGQQYCHPLPVKCFEVKPDNSVCNCPHTVCRLKVNITRPENIDQGNDLYCKVQVNDPTMIPSPDFKADGALLTIVIPSEKSRRPVQESPVIFYTKISRMASRYAKVYDFPNQKSDAFALSRESSRAFHVTFSSGIVYVDDVTILRKLNSQVNLTINHAPHTITLVVNIEGPLRPIDDNQCNVTCASYMEATSCNSGCGLGSVNGRCRWRSGDERSYSRNFSTCVSDLSTCTDHVCDEREILNILLCPQDCTRTTIRGEGNLNGKYTPPRGIDSGTSPCWCDYAGECSCFRPSSFQNVPTSHITSRVEPKRPIRKNSIETSPEKPDFSDYPFKPKVSSSTAQSQRDSDIGCDWHCRTTIAAVTGCVGAIVCVIILTWRLRRLHCQKGQPLKHVGSSASISGVPSEYHEDYRSPHRSPQWSPKRSLGYNVTREDCKWEFPRDKLMLDETIGEGEFGRVVKAKAYGMDVREGYKCVAVKMLKNCDSSGELQDLLSEYNLLKDIDHPNVIKLLGACTRNGPFYVIVEYCEHGSLLQYLRNSRLEENGYINHRSRRYFMSQSESGDSTEPQLLNIRDLLSFAWQISKGMQYLSEIKLVHRDLAARNVLVGTGKVLKISDFGLTRDVYEADTYLKRSKGRIPVKWLAPESLYAQVYTTQSDVWSFGIVLWEIVTLGAPPYPGIPPERLYSLLIAGYRMDRPDGCSDELYAVMQKCWKADPTERPIFANLTAIFDGMLQQRTEYLELTGGFENVDTDLFDRCPDANEHRREGNISTERKEPRLSVKDDSGYGDPYLTPASRSDMTLERCTVQQCESSHESGVQTDGENVALLLECRTAVFSNSIESEDEDDNVILKQPFEVVA